MNVFFGAREKVLSFIETSAFASGELLVVSCGKILRIELTTNQYQPEIRSGNHWWIAIAGGCDGITLYSWILLGHDTNGKSEPKISSPKWWWVV